jgi:hypothetical protein
MDMDMPMVDYEDMVVSQIAERLEKAEAEIVRLRAALDKYRGQVNRFGEHTAADDLMPNMQSDRLAEDKQEG